MKIDFIQAIRGLAAFLVLIFHSLILVRALHQDQAGGVLTLAMGLGDVGVDLFFMVSGFVMALVMEQEGDGARFSVPWLREFLRRRFWRVIPPYWIFTLLALAAAYVFSRGKLGAGADIFFKTASSFLLWPGATPFLLMVGWSLVYEVCFYILFGGLCYLFGRRGVALSALACLVLTVALAIGAGKDEILSNYSVSLPLYFSAGLVMALARRRAETLVQDMSAGVLLGMAAALVILIGLQGSQVAEHANRTGWRVVDYGPIALGIFLLIWLLAGLLQRFNWFGLMHVGTWSYSLYLSHWLVLNAIVAAMARLGAPNVVVTLLFSLSFCLVVAWLSWRFMEVPLLRWSRRPFAPGLTADAVRRHGV